MSDNIKSASVGAFFLLLLLIGIGLFRDYGISWDEKSQRTTGAVTLKYVEQMFAPFLLPEEANTLPELEYFYNRDYGVAFTTPAVALEQLFHLKDSRDIYMFRHLLTYLVFIAGVYAVYRLACRRFMDWRLGLLAALFMVLTPRIFAESFYNSKDIVFMAAFAIVMNTMINFFLKPGIKTAILHALATAFAIDVRIMAVIIPALTIVIIIITLTRKQFSPSRDIASLSIYLIVTSLFVVIMWPWLWSDPLGNFVQAFINMSKFREAGDVRYMGRFIASSKLPWHYAFVWISITTPLLYLGLFVIGCAFTVRQVIENLSKCSFNDDELQDTVFLGLFFGPILTVILLHSVLYDGWRHLYFVYPALLILAVKGWVELWNVRKAISLTRIALGALTFFSVAYYGLWMCDSHPFQNVYFNAFAGNWLRNRYEMDYWGLGNRKALEYILTHDRSENICVWADCFTPLQISFLIIKPQDRARLMEAGEEFAHSYVLTNYRRVPEIDDSKYSKDYDLFYQIKVDKEVILSVYKRKNSTKKELQKPLGDLK